MAARRPALDRFACLRLGGVQRQTFTTHPPHPRWPIQRPDLSFPARCAGRTAAPPRAPQRRGTAGGAALPPPGAGAVPPPPALPKPPPPPPQPQPFGFEWLRGWMSMTVAPLPRLEPYGTELVTVGSIFFLGMWAMDDVLLLRVCGLAGGVLFFLYYLSRTPPLVIPAAWGSLNILLNGAMLLVLLLKAAESTEFSAEELALFEEHFAPSGVSASDFKALLGLGAWRTAAPGEVLATCGDRVDRVLLVAKGGVRATDKRGQRIEALDTYPGRAKSSPVGDAGAWIGDLALMQALDQTRGVAAAKPAADDDLHVQKLLKALGFYDGKIDGDLNSKQAVGAVRKFQHAAGLEPDGCAGPITRRAVHAVNARKHLEVASQSLATHECSPREAVRYVAWDLEKLNAALRKDAELERAARRVLAAAAVRKAVASISKAKAPSRRKTSAFCGDDVQFKLYLDSLAAACACVRVGAEAKRGLRVYRQEHCISRAEHARALSCLEPRWTPDDFDDGERFKQTAPFSAPKLAALWRKVADFAAAAR
ncbi:hypothetical protein M885DRAFT_510062 [Pelagophyceae sp. CCMP2097]|nr:hypothetical protein M885DRAFT_510062 [Pelagophyceae sp. CCMP2097]